MPFHRWSGEELTAACKQEKLWPLSSYLKLLLEADSPNNAPEQLPAPPVIYLLDYWCGPFRNSTSGIHISLSREKIYTWLQRSKKYHRSKLWLEEKGRVFLVLCSERMQCQSVYCAYNSFIPELCLLYFGCELYLPCRVDLHLLEWGGWRGAGGICFSSSKSDVWAANVLVSTPKLIIF